MIEEDFFQVRLGLMGLVGFGYTRRVGKVFLREKKYKKVVKACFNVESKPV